MAGVALASGSCKHTDPPGPQSTVPPPPPTTGTVDCATGTVWTTTTFAGLVPAVERALAQSSPQDALGTLLSTHSSGEVTCVVGYVHDQSAEQAAAAPSDTLAGQRVTSTAAWLAMQSSKGLTVTNYYKKTEAR